MTSPKENLKPKTKIFF